MSQVVTIALANNAALLMVLSIIYELGYLVPPRFQRWRPVVDGLLIAVICTVIMSMPFTLTSGIVFDTRSILISVTAFTFGLVPAAITVAAAVLVRVLAGGAGTVAGIAVILSSALIGLAWRRWLYPRSPRWRWLGVYLMGIVVHAAMLGCMALLPAGSVRPVLRAIAVPVLVVYPIATVLLSLMLLRQQQRRQAQEQVRASEERFRALFDKAPIGYQSLNEEGRFIDVNQQWLDLLGYDRGEVIGRWFGDFLADDRQRDRFLERFPLFKQAGRIRDEFEMRRKDGQILSLSFESRISRDPEGRFRRTHCVLQDITERKQAEAALRESEEKYRILFETMAVGVVYQATDGRILSANPAAERILGFSLAELSDRSSRDPDWRAIREDGTPVDGSEHPAMVALRNRARFGPFVMGVYQPKLRDHVWLSIIATPLFRPGDPEPCQVYTTFQDITAERKAYQDYHLLFTRMVDAFALHELVCDDQGQPADYRFLAVNPAFEAMTGLRAADIVGRNVMEVLPDTERHWIEAYGRVAQTGEPTMFEDYSEALGKYFEVSAYRPAPGQFACTFSDITQRKLAEAAERETLSRLQALLDHSPGPIVILDADVRCVVVSRSAASILGMDTDALIGKRPDDVMPAEAAQAILDGYARVRDDGQPVVFTTLIPKDGAERWYVFRLFPITPAEGGTGLTGLIGFEVTERVRAEQALAASEKKYENYIENAPYLVFVVDRTGRYVEVNRSAAEITGYRRERLLEMNIRDITMESSLPDALAAFRTLMTTGSMYAELQYRHADGSARWWTIRAVRLSEDRFLGFSTDITAEKEAEENILYLNTHDPLTGLFNRSYLDVAAAAMTPEECDPLSILVADINGLKLINDAFGVAEGDRLIVRTAALLAGCTREGEVLARTGGDEFALLMPKTDSAAARERMREIQEACAKANLQIPNEAFRINFSAGTGTRDGTGADLHAVSQLAVDYMNRGKLLESKSSHSAILSSIKATMLEKSHGTEEHAERLATLTRETAKSLGLTQSEMDHLELLALLHDIGKVGIPDQILNKPGPLTPDEWDVMKKHPEIGYRIATASPELVPIADSILSHHERWDGNGYPQQLSGESIPRLSRILAVIDSYDAMTADRPYRKAMTHAQAVEELRRNAGTQYDPEMVRVFLEVMEKHPPE